MLRPSLPFCFALVGLASPLFAAQNPSSSTQESTAAERTQLDVTIYNHDRALVQEKRKVNVKSGQGIFQYKDVSAQIDPSSLIIKSSGDLKVLEQNYEYDLITSEKLLDKFVGKKVTLMINENGASAPAVAQEATLLANNGTPVFEINGKIHLGMPGRILLPSIPENLAAQPSLKWLVNSQSGGSQNLDLSYLTTGFNWSSNYVLLLDSDDVNAELAGWVTLNNNSGMRFENARVKLVAGEVHQVQNQNLYAGAPRYMAKVAMAEADMAPVQERTFDEYHLYTLPREVTLAASQNKQIQLFPSSGIKVKKIYTAKPGYFPLDNGNNGENKVPIQVQIEFKTGKDNNLDLPIPAGNVRVYKKDGSNGQIFIGEDRVSHTPKNEKINIQTGEAFDIVCEYKQTNYKRINDRTHETSWEVKIRNHKSEDVTVNFDQPSYGDWNIVKGPKPEKLNASTLRFSIPVKKEGEQVLNYTIQTKY